jgi:hypothetical protein
MASDFFFQFKEIRISVRRQKPGRSHEKERYLTADQQKVALAFWDKWNVNYSQCDQPDCPCRSH